MTEEEVWNSEDISLRFHGSGRPGSQQQACYKKPLSVRVPKKASTTAYKLSVSQITAAGICELLQLQLQQGQRIRAVYPRIVSLFLKWLQSYSMSKVKS